MRSQDICSPLKIQMATTHGRKVVDESRNVIDLVKNPNKFSVMIVGIVLVLILIIILLVVLIRKLIKKRRRKKK